MTWRQFLGWIGYERLLYDIPSRTDLYVMQAAHEARYSNYRGTNTRVPLFQSKEWVLEFPPEDDGTEMDPEEARRQHIEARKSMAIAQVGGKVRRQYVTKDGIPCDEHGNPL